MADTRTYAPGTPSWIDLSSPDIESSKAFYGRLFGWEARVAPDPEAGGYTMFLLDGKEVAGVGPIFNPGQPPVWSTYVSTADADATAQAVRDAGGQVVMGPMDVLKAGRMAVFVDTTGAYISVWQPGEHHGAEVTGVPNTFCWTELNTRDMQAAKTFYQKLFGWRSKDSPLDEGREYTEWTLDGASVAGGYDIAGQVPDTVPAHWLPYFAVGNCDAAVNTARELGATIVVPTMDVPVGRFTVVRDPHGAVFGMIRLNQ